jgi:ankyrin repeat protein
MKSFRIALIGGAIAMLSAPAAAQYKGSDGSQFIDAVQKRDGTKAIQLITDHPTIIDTKDGKGDTPLIITVRGSDRDWTVFLLNKGADTNAEGAGGDTPLIAAAKAGFDDAIPWLLSKGAKVDGTNRSGETALIIAVQQRNAHMVRELLEAGADPDHSDAAAGYSARDYANRDTRSRDIQKLINDKKPKGGSTASN